MITERKGSPEAPSRFPFEAQIEEVFDPQYPEKAQAFRDELEKHHLAIEPREQPPVFDIDYENIERISDPLTAHCAEKLQEWLSCDYIADDFGTTPEGMKARSAWHNELDLEYGRYKKEGMKGNLLTEIFHKNKYSGNDLDGIQMMFKLIEMTLGTKTSSKDIEKNLSSLYNAPPEKRRALLEEIEKAAARLLEEVAEKSHERYAKAS